MSLLDDALNQPIRHNTKEPEIEVLELAIAWLQVMTVMRQAGRTDMIEIRIKAGDGGK